MASVGADTRTHDDGVVEVTLGNWLIVLSPVGPVVDGCVDSLKVYVRAFMRPHHPDSPLAILDIETAADKSMNFMLGSRTGKRKSDNEDLEVPESKAARQAGITSSQPTGNEALTNTSESNEQADKQVVKENQAITEFVAITGESEGTALQYLQREGNDLEKAVQLFFSEKEGEANRDTPRDAWEEGERDRAEDPWGSNDMYGCVPQSEPPREAEQTWPSEAPVDISEVTDHWYDPVREREEQETNGGEHPTYSYAESPDDWPAVRTSSWDKGKEREGTTTSTVRPTSTQPPAPILSNDIFMAKPTGATELLSTELHNRIFSFLPPFFVLRTCSRVCRFWRAVSCEDSLWQLLYRKHLSSSDTPPAGNEWRAAFLKVLADLVQIERRHTAKRQQVVQRLSQTEIGELFSWAATGGLEVFYRSILAHSSGVGTGPDDAISQALLFRFV